MRHNHEKEIDGSTWRVNEFSASEGLRLLTSLTKLCGGPIAKAVEALPKDGSILDAHLNIGLLGAALSDLTKRLDEDAVLSLIKRLVACTSENGEDVGRRFDVVFQGRYLTLFKVLGFVLEVNFKVPLREWLEAASLGSQEHEAEAEQSK